MSKEDANALDAEAFEREIKPAKSSGRHRTFAGVKLCYQLSGPLPIIFSCGNGAAVGRPRRNISNIVVCT